MRKGQQSLPVIKLIICVPTLMTAIAQISNNTLYIALQIITHNNKGHDRRRKLFKKVNCNCVMTVTK